MARWEPPEEQVVEAPKPRRWPVVVLLLAILGVAGAGLWMIRRQLRPPGSSMAEATNVRSDISVAGDSLEIVVRWRLSGTPPAPPPDSMRIEAGLGDGRESSTEVVAMDHQADTLRLAAPAVGGTATGYSCAAPVHRARLARESCTPWQFVRPSAQVPKPGKPDTVATRPPHRTPAPHAAAILRIVIEPEAQQVDPDVGGRCAAWQRHNPGRAVWLEVNQEAVPECMGPNGKPTVAKFCAFAILSDGRRVKTENSTNDLYCERLYQAWVRQKTV